MTPERPMLQKSEISYSASNSAKTTSIRPGWAFLSIFIVLAAGIVTSVQAPDPLPRSSADKSLFDWLRYPVERNPGLRLPAPPARFNSASLADDNKHGLAVGFGGTIVATSDGGDTWAALDSGVINSLYSVHCDAGCEKAWVVGSGGTILTTSDAGKHWSPQIYVTSKPIGFRDVHFQKGGEKGWIVGDGGIVLVTSDAGKSWQSQPTGVVHNLSSIHFNADGQRGWIVSNGGVILATTNGGREWKSSATGEDSLLSVWLDSDGKNGWAVGHNSVLATTDGGNRWRNVSNLVSDATEPLWYRSVAFSSDGRRGWITREDGTIFNTVDGGTTWAKQNLSFNLEQVRFDAAGQRGLVLATAGTVLQTLDGGRNWITRTSSESSLIYHIHFHADNLLGWAVGASGIILATEDGGAHWSAQDSNVNQSLNSVHFALDGRSGWAVGDEGVIIATDDGGKHWNRQKSGVKVGLHAVAFDSGGQLGWCVGGSGVVLETNNAGRDWHETRLNGDLLAVYFEPSGRRGWIVGPDGRMFASADGGQTWTRQKSGTGQVLEDIWFDAGSNRGWAVGTAGTIITSSDGGNTWLPQISGTDTDLNSVRFAGDGQLGMAAGDAGVILTTKDGGAHWIQADSKVGSGRLSAALSQNGSTAWAGGYPPALLRSNDGGKNWEPMRWPLSNQRYPAPWFWLALIPAALFLRMSIRIDSAPPTASIEAIGATDAPVGDFAGDRLQFGSLARGISRFLRNTNTRPPLTIAVSGDWGSGKSTLMELVCADLRQYGTRAVWFNAWHHQQEEQLLAALLNAIGDKSLPSIASIDGLVFRLRLLLMRSKKNFVLVFAGLAACSILTGFLCGHNFSEWTKLWETLGNIGSNLSQQNPAAISTGITLGDVGLLVPQLVTGGAALISLYKGLKAFKLDPAVLLSTTAENFRLKDASAQTSFRSKFAEQFAEVTDALPFTMVIVIDDLDRCRPETVLTVMEAVNFLVSSGKCFVMFGMATHRVQAALGLAFEKVAAELTELDVPIPADASPEVREHAARDRRLAYARDYLDKLINIEIVVPTRTDILSRLLVSPPRTQDSTYADAIGQILEYWPLWLATVIVVMGLLFGLEHTLPNQQPAVSIQKAGAPAATIDALLPFGASGSARATTTPGPQQISNRYVPEIQSNNVVAADKWAIGTTLALLVAIIGGFVLYRLRAASYQVKDSQQFLEALLIWTPVVQRRRGTPRAIKRFGNRLRYLAMLQQDSRADESGFDELRRWLGFLTTRRTEGADANARQRTDPAESVEETVLVALASFHEVYGLEWRTQLQPTGQGELEGVVRKAIKSYPTITSTTWPPATADLDAFERLLGGVRISGG